MAETSDLRTRLQSLGLTQVALAELLGVTTRAVQKWVAKGRAPQTVEIILIVVAHMAKRSKKSPEAVLRDLSESAQPVTKPAHHPRF